MCGLSGCDFDFYVQDFCLLQLLDEASRGRTDYRRWILYRDGDCGGFEPFISADFDDFFEVWIVWCLDFDVNFNIMQGLLDARIVDFRFLDFPASNFD